MKYVIVYIKKLGGGAGILFSLEVRIFHSLFELDEI
jgi:hypothetical protein